MTSTENLEKQQPACECGCCGPTAATAVMEPPTTTDKSTDETCQCGCGSTGTRGEGCECGCTASGCECGCSGGAD